VYASEKQLYNPHPKASRNTSQKPNAAQNITGKVVPPRNPLPCETEKNKTKY
jgi:hypothetical protein